VTTRWWRVTQACPRLGPPSSSRVPRLPAGACAPTRLTEVELHRNAGLIGSPGTLLHASEDPTAALTSLLQQAPSSWQPSTRAPNKWRAYRGRGAALQYCRQEPPQPQRQAVVQGVHRDHRGAAPAALPRPRRAKHLPVGRAGAHPQAGPDFGVGRPQEGVGFELVSQQAWDGGLPLGARRCLGRMQAVGAGWARLRRAGQGGVSGQQAWSGQGGAAEPGSAAAAPARSERALARAESTRALRSASATFPGLIVTAKRALAAVYSWAQYTWRERSRGGAYTRSHKARWMASSHLPRAEWNNPRPGRGVASEAACRRRKGGALVQGVRTGGSDTAAPVNNEPPDAPWPPPLGRAPASRAAGRPASGGRPTLLTGSPQTACRSQGQTRCRLGCGGRGGGVAGHGVGRAHLRHDRVRGTGLGGAQAPCGCPRHGRARHLLPPRASPTPGKSAAAAGHQ
jgi:hypothetical protein